MIKGLLESLKLKGALESLNSLGEVKNKEEFLINLLQAEVTHRENQLAKRRLSEARFLVEKEWCDINKDLNPSIKWRSLESIGAEFVKKRTNLCLMGQQGTGKTHSLISLGRELCREGVTVKFFTACNLVILLEEANKNCVLSKLKKSLLKPKLLIIDELGFVPFSENGSRLLFDVFTSRYETGSIAVSTNLSFDKWVQIFGTAELTAALLDRFTHRCETYKFEGKSVGYMAAKEKRNLHESIK